MTVQEVIDRVDSVKPNAYSNADKTAWLSEVEGKVQTEILLKPLEDLVQPKSVTDELLVPYPYDSLYSFFLQAMVDLHNGEYDRYNNTYAVFNTKWNEYEKWHCTHYPTVGSLKRGETKVGE